MSKEKMDAESNTEEAGRGRKHKGWFERERCTLPIKVNFWH